MENASYNPKSHIRITPDARFDANALREVWQYRDLIRLFVVRGFTVRYKQTILGPMWILLQPLATSLVYLFVFGGIARLGTNGVPGILFYLGSNALWSYFASCLTSNAYTFTGNAYLFGKVYFPRLVTPVSNVLSSCLRFFIEMILFVALYVWFFAHGQVSGSFAAILALPLILLELGCLGLGIGIIFSSVTVKYRDLHVLIGFAMNLWLYATPVVYPLSTFTNPTILTAMMLNPVTAPIELFRALAFNAGYIPAWSVLYSIGITVAILIVGVKVFSKAERNFIDTV